jgi:hypothetical protein
VNVIPRPLRAADGATTRRPHFTWRAGVAAFAALVLGAAMLTIGGSASALNGRRTGPLDNRGFPAYYVDDAGRAVQMCDDGSAICQGANRGDLVAPDGEALYWSALTTLRTRRGPLEVEFALEASFEGQRPVVFRRLRIRGHLGRRGRYILHHPYGNLPFTAIRARGPQRRRDTRQQVLDPRWPVCAAYGQVAARQVTAAGLPRQEPPHAGEGWHVPQLHLGGGTERQDHRS